MRVLIFCNNFPHSYSDAFVSGLVKNGFNQAKAVSETGAQVTVITDGFYKGKWNIAGVTAFGVGNGLGKGVLRAFLLDIRMTWCFLRLKPKNFDVLHIHSGNLLLLFLLKKMRIIKHNIVYTAHGTTTPELNAHQRNGSGLYGYLVRINGKVQEWVDTVMWKSANKIISVSAFQMQEMQSIYGVDREKIIKIYNGVDNELYYPDASQGKLRRHKLGLDSSVPIVLFVGRLVWKKGVHVLLNTVSEVVKNVPDVAFVFVLGELGRGFDANYVDEMCKQYKSSPYRDRIRFEFNVSEEELPSYYQSANICVFPSLQYESLPTVIYESMACGVPIITQGSWGVPEVINNVLLTEKELTSQILSRSIVTFLSDNQRLETVSKTYLEEIPTFYWKELAVQYLNLYESLRK